DAMSNRQWSPEVIEELRAVRDSKSYRQTHGTFAFYCKDELNISRAYAHRLLSGTRSPKQNIPAELRWEIWERDDFRCHYCGVRRFLSIDHIVPESQGGTLDPRN